MDFPDSCLQQEVGVVRLRRRGLRRNDARQTNWKHWAGSSGVSLSQSFFHFFLSFSIFTLFLKLKNKKNKVVQQLLKIMFLLFWSTFSTYFNISLTLFKIFTIFQFCIHYITRSFLLCQTFSCFDIFPKKIAKQYKNVYFIFFKSLKFSSSYKHSI